MHADFCRMNLTEALEIMNSGAPFTCKYVSFDRKRKTGGELKTDTLVITSLPEIEREKKPATESKAQNHYQNATRNFFVVADNVVTSVIRKVHIILVLEINGNKLML